MGRSWWKVEANGRLGEGGSSASVAKAFVLLDGLTRPSLEPTRWTGTRVKLTSEEPLPPVRRIGSSLRIIASLFHLYYI